MANTITVRFDADSAEFVPVSPSWADTYSTELRSASILKGDEETLRTSLPLTAAQQDAFMAALTDVENPLPVIDGMTVIELPVGKRGRKPKSGQSLAAITAAAIAAAAPVEVEAPAPVKRSRKASAE